MSWRLLDAILAPDGLRVVFQPIYGLSSRGALLHAVEAQVRGPAGTPLASAHGLWEYVRKRHHQETVDRVATELALSQALRLEQPVRLHLNVHACTLAGDSTFPSFIAETARRFCVPLPDLTLEIQSDAAAYEPSFALVVRALTELPVRVAVDDVSLGSSALRMLLGCRAHYIKLDRSFVQGCGTDRSKRAAVRSVVQLSELMHADVVAQGVENILDLETLVQVGVAYGQGHLLSPPMPAPNLPLTTLPFPKAHAPLTAHGAHDETPQEDPRGG